MKTDRYMCSMKKVKEKYQKVHLNLNLHQEFRPNYETLYRWVALVVSLNKYFKYFLLQSNSG